VNAPTFFVRRMITCYGVFDSPITENTISILKLGVPGIRDSLEILTDHGTQFVSAGTRNMLNIF